MGDCGGIYSGVVFFLGFCMGVGIGFVIHAMTDRLGEVDTNEYRD